MRKKDGVEALRDFNNSCIHNQHQDIDQVKMKMIINIFSKKLDTPGNKNLTTEEFNLLYSLGLRDFRAFSLDGLTVKE